MKARRDVIKKEQVKQKVLARLKNYKLRMPLVNPETLFSLGVWEQVFDFIYRYLKEASKSELEILENKKLVVNILDLYFMKVYDEGFNFKAAEKLFSDIFKTEYHLIERNDRNDEPSINIGKDFGLYDYRGAICFSAGGAVNSDVLDIKKGSFPRGLVKLQMTVEEFLKFVDIIEQGFMYFGAPEMCRAFMTVESKNFSIEIKCLYEPPVDLIAMRCFSESGDFGFMNCALKAIEPEFVIKMKV